MKFPIDVVQVGNKIFLLQGEITKEFKKKLNEVDDDMYNNETRITFTDEDGDLTDISMRSEGQPLLTSYRIFLNGTSRGKDYQIVSYERYLDECDYYSVFKNCINHYKKAMGYE